MKDDLISRTMAINGLKKLPNAGINWFVSAEAVFDMLSNLPSVQSVDAQSWINECAKWDANTRNNMAFTLRTVLAHREMDAIDEDNIKRLLKLFT